MRTLQRHLLYLSIVFMPFQDTILGKTPLGFFGSNVSSLPLAAYALIGALRWVYEGKSAVSRTALIWAVYALALSLIYVVAWGPVSHGTSVLYKTFSMGIVFFLWAYTIFGIDYMPTKGLRWSTNIAFLIVILGVLACDIHVPGLASLGASSLVHITPEIESGRWRSFSTEPSMFSATAISLGIAAAYLSQRRVTKSFLLVATLILLLASQSKGGLLVLAISAFLISLLNKPSAFRAIVYLLICGVIAGIMGFLVYTQLNAVDLALATGTIATRFSLAVWTIMVVVHHPWGVGLSGFYEAMTIYLPRAMDWVEKISPVPLNFEEIQQYVTGTDVPLDAKCFLFEYLVSFGIPFLIAYLVFSKRLILALVARKQQSLLIGCVFLLVSFSTYVNGMALYAGFYLLGLGWHEYGLRNRDDRRRIEAVRNFPANHIPELNISTSSS